jgi:type VI secretion system protein VasG
MITSLKPLVERLNDVARGAMEGAAGLCVSRTHYEIEIEHFLSKALEYENGDLALIASHYGANRKRLALNLQNTIDRLKTGNARGPVFSPPLVKMFSEAWVIATLTFNAPEVRTGHALLALLSEEGLARMVAEMSGELRRIPFASLVEEFDKVTERSVEARAAEAIPDTQEAKSDAVSAHTPFLDRYTVDLTRDAREGRTEVVVGRDAEIRQMIDVLLRRRQNNPILTGEAGVGKTAVVEGLARKIADGDVPPALANVRLLSLDLSLLQAGAGVKGEFENRLKGLVQEVKASPQPVILFIDEAVPRGEGLGFIGDRQRDAGRRD